MMYQICTYAQNDSRPKHGTRSDGLSSNAWLFFDLLPKKIFIVVYLDGDSESNLVNIDNSEVITFKFW